MRRIIQHLTTRGRPLLGEVGVREPLLYLTSLLSWMVPPLGDTASELHLGSLITLQLLIQHLTTRGRPLLREVGVGEPFLSAPPRIWGLKANVSPAHLSPAPLYDTSHHHKQRS